MSLAQPTAPDAKPGPGLTLNLNLNSNNPFRNPRNASPAIPSPGLATPRGSPVNNNHSNNERPVSRNPFLAAFEQELGDKQQQPRKPPLQDTVDAASRNSRALSGDSFGINMLSLNDGPPATGAPLTKSQSPPDGVSTHRPTRSEDERRRARPATRLPMGRKNPAEELDIFASPEKNGDRKPRRNSESSVLDKPPTSEEERRRRERHRRERRHDGSRSRHGRRKPHGLDIIDKLDVTGIYGAGLFHHDGPFDACNPHRNRKKDHRAPMQAFPENSANMALGGTGPINDRLDLNKIHGTGIEGYKDYGNAGYDAGYSRRADPTRNLSFDPYARAEPVHGEESIGLGTSTFLEGAPASRKAIERRESEVEAQQKAEIAAGGLGRKKSIAQRLRGMSTGRSVRYGDGTAVAIRSPDARHMERHVANNVNGLSSSEGAAVKARSGQAQGAGGSAKARGVTLKDEPSLIDSSYDEAYDKKGAQIKVVEEKKVEEKKEQKKEEEEEEEEEEAAKANDAESPADGRATASSSPKKPLAVPLERKVKTDNSDDATTPSAADAGGEVKPSGGGSFLSRVKSLKGGRRPIRRPS